LADRISDRGSEGNVVALTKLTQRNAVSVSFVDPSYGRSKKDTRVYDANSNARGIHSHHASRLAKSI
jgi:hypothetical protein